MMLEAVLVGAVGGGASILYATVGETISERSGVINLGTEGSMLCGALAAFAAGIATGNPWFGVLAGIVAGAALAAVHAGVVLYRGANQIATGLVVTFLGLGLTGLFGQEYVKQGVVGFSDVAIPGLSSIPFVGPILFDHDPLTYLSFVVAPAAWWFLFRTRNGLKVRTAGERAEVLHTFGTSPTKVRALAVIAGGALAGVGGAQLSTALTLNWSENMTVGRGFVAVALVIFAAWDPLKAIGGAYLFSGAQALEFELQASGSSISPFLLACMPYLVVILVLALLGRKRINASPAELDKVFQAAPA
jgi:general nucleoside transport system permease protein